MFDALPEAWKRTTLGEIIRLEYGRSLPESTRVNGNVPVYGSNGIVGFHSEALVNERGIVIGRKGTVGSVNVTNGPFWPIDTTYYVRSLRDLDFWWLVATLDHAQLSELNEATGVPGLNRENAYRQRIMLPPLDEQRRISAVLRSLDIARQTNLETLQQAIRARAAVLSATFEDAPWEPVRLAELGHWQSGGTPSKEISSYWGGDVPWICPRDMKVPVISRSQDTITRDALGGSCKLVPPGTLLLVVRGMILAKAIPTAIAGVETTHNQDIKAFRPNGRATPRFVQLCLQHQEADLLKVVNTATHGTKKLDSATINEILVPLPDLATQQSISEMISCLDLATVLYGAEHLRLSEVRRSLSSELLSGRVRVPSLHE